MKEVVHLAIIAFPVPTLPWNIPPRQSEQCEGNGIIVKSFAGNCHTRRFPCSTVHGARGVKGTYRGNKGYQLILGTLGRQGRQGGLHRKKKVREFPVPRRDVTTKLSLSGNNDVITELFLPRGSLVSDIPAGDGKLVNIFLRCRRSISGKGCHRN